MKTSIDRRQALMRLAGGSAAGGFGLLTTGELFPRDRGQAASKTGLPALKITDVKNPIQAPNRIRTGRCWVLTSEPGLYGLGCATFTQRA
jgi:mannonate dehydratase